MEQRTTKQNSALHKFFELVATTLNDAGLDMRKALRADIDIPWSKTSVKEFMWKPVQEALIGKKSTKELTTKQVDEVYNVLNKYFGEKYGLHQIFPSIEQIKLKLDEEKKEKDRSTKTGGQE